MPTADDFRHELFVMMAEAQKAGTEFVEINAGELHKRVGGYPGRDHRMPNCCQVMKAQIALDYGDAIVDEPPSGHGPSLTIRYRLPRRDNAAL
jgi:5-methylcytosine-specific restriction protein A